ncbi:MAG: aminoacyl-tRNA hydrolase [Syntrophales bacterium]|nr:aminoacyl-tRNA hydrolase [Syntrophales bacterium]
MRLIVGLGNPGSQYQFSKHNMGFLVLDKLAQRQNISLSQRGFDARFGKGKIDETTVLLAKPQAFMNLSGVAVRKLTEYFKAGLEDLIVVHDDLDLPFEIIRLKKGGGYGGHKGLGSIIDYLGGSEFIRVRLGIGKPPPGTMVEEYVLGCFSKEEMKILPDITSRACDAVGEVISSGIQTAMNKFNVKGLTKNLDEEV